MYLSRLRGLRWLLSAPSKPSLTSSWRQQQPFKLICSSATLILQLMPTQPESDSYTGILLKSEASILYWMNRNSWTLLLFTNWKGWNSKHCAVQSWRLELVNWVTVLYWVTMLLCYLVTTALLWTEFWADLVKEVAGVTWGERWEEVFSLHGHGVISQNCFFLWDFSLLIKSIVELWEGGGGEDLWDQIGYIFSRSTLSLGHHIRDKSPSPRLKGSFIKPICILRQKNLDVVSAVLCIFSLCSPLVKRPRPIIKSLPTSCGRFVFLLIRKENDL